MPQRSAAAARQHAQQLAPPAAAVADLSSWMMAAAAVGRSDSASSSSSDGGGSDGGTADAPDLALEAWLRTHNSVRWARLAEEALAQLQASLLNTAAADLGASTWATWMLGGQSGGCLDLSFKGLNLGGRGGVPCVLARVFETGLGARVVSLSLEGNELADEAAAALAELLGGGRPALPVLALLDLNDNLIGDDGAAAIASAAVSQQSLRMLSLASPAFLKKRVSRGGGRGGTAPAPMGVVCYCMQPS